MSRLHRKPARLAQIHGIGVDRMGRLADVSREEFLRLENLDVDIPPDPPALERTRRAAGHDPDNSYLPFLGKDRLREVAAAHVSRISGVSYGADHCVISAGGLSGILNVLLATVEVGDEVIVTDPTYIGLLNRIRLAGGVPHPVPFTFTPGKTWKLDRDALRRAVTPKTRCMLLMSPSMPSGAMLDEEDWALAAELCVTHDLLMVVDSAMERLVFDRRPVLHPASLPGMAERTISVGSASKELRMIGWRVGWIVAPDAFLPHLAAVGIANVVVPVGIAQDAVAVALESSYATLPGFVARLEARRDTVLDELAGLPVGVPAGGWSLLMRTSDWGLDGETVSEHLLAQGICATAMTGWGDRHGVSYIRFVFSNEPRARLRGLGKRVRAALGPLP